MAEDDDAVRDMAKTALEGLGYTVWSRRTGGRP
jgi:CheY-like chemotaxis protein